MILGIRACKRPNLQQQRTELTQQKLLRSAEKIFTRDGFDAAKIEEIAADAGYSRGAFYANFESKEDLFMVLVESGLKGRLEEVHKAMSQNSDPEKKLTVMVQTFRKQMQARPWTLLMLEFKLFVWRHPKLKTKLGGLHTRLVSIGEGIFQEICSGFNCKPPVSVAALALGFGALAQGLDLERLLEVHNVSEEETEIVLRRYLDAMLGRVRP